MISLKEKCHRGSNSTLRKEFNDDTVIKKKTCVQYFSPIIFLSVSITKTVHFPLAIKSDMYKFYRV